MVLGSSIRSGTRRGYAYDTALAMVAFAWTAGPLNAAEPLQNLSDLDVLVAATMGAEIGQPGGARAAVDRRLKLKACPQSPEIQGPEMNAMVVSCPAVGWKIHVPLLTRANDGAARGAASREIGIRRGEPLLLTVERPSFTLTRVMIADRDGKVGDVIPVREDPRGKPIFVRIVEPGRATILSQ